MNATSMRHRRSAFVVGGVGAALVISLAGAGANLASAATTPAPTSCPTEEGVTPTSIKLGFFSPRTGPAAANFSGGEEAARLRVAQENAKGGVFGRKIELVGFDDQSNAAIQVSQATKALQNDHVFGIIMTSATDAAFPAFKSANVPVTGFNAIAMSTDRNAFSATGPNSTGVVNTAILERLKAGGATNVALIAHNSPSAASGMQNTSKILGPSGTGLKQALLILDEPQGAHDATSTALRVKNAGADGVYMSMFTDGVVSIVQAMNQQGVKPKAVLGTGVIDPAVISKAGNALEGMIGATYGTVPAGVPGRPGVRTYVNGMKAAGINPYQATAPVAFAATDLMMKGLKLAGPCPTRQKFIDALRKVTNYDAGGLIPEKISFTPGLTPNGNPVKCSWFVTVKNGQAVPDAKATCGVLVNTTTGQVVG